MSRIPASPQNTIAPAALPAVVKATPQRSLEQAPAAQANSSPSQASPSHQSDQVALEKRGGSMEHYDLGLDAPSGTEPVTQAELEWALDLEDKIVKGHQPSPQAFEKYADIAARLSDANPARQIEEAEAISPAEIKWALRLEERVKQGYQPAPEEVATYEKIYAQLAAQESISSGIPAKELSWGQNLMEKVGQGYQPDAKEMKRYEALYTEAQEAIQSKHQEPEDKATQWAQNLEKKVMQGYTASESEIKRYTTIYERLQQGIK